MLEKLESFLFLILISFLLISCSFTDNETRFLNEKETIYSMLKEHYAGFDKMVERGFTEEAWENVSDYDDIRELFDKCVDDCHLLINNNHGFTYRKQQIYDTDSIRSDDPPKTFRLITTTNTYYVRYNSCYPAWNEYAQLSYMGEGASKYDFIVLDFRSNSGGGNIQQDSFFRTLRDNNYKGIVYITQDNWSVSAGEAWYVASAYKNLINVKLIGTHSGGWQKYGNCREYTKNNIYFYLPSNSFEDYLPDNYLGEGIGYEPDIWATKNNMKTILEGFGLDLTNIVFN